MEIWLPRANRCKNNFKVADRVGIIDLGSNTFHLLIVDWLPDGTFTTVYKGRAFVGLAEDGIEMLSAKAIKKGIETLTDFKKTLSKYQTDKFKVVGTAALRSAKNSSDFINDVRHLLGFEVEVIAGNREADLIYKGVKVLYPMTDNHLIMDIGGGSVEFIVIKDGKNIWAGSYNIGVGVLHNAFHKSEPISAHEARSLKEFLYDQLSELKKVTKDLNIISMIGASGSFEVVESMNGKAVSTDSISKVTLSDYKSVSSKITQASFEERSQMEGLPASRTKLIVVAMILIDVVIDIIEPSEIIISPFALKEGLLSELKT